MEVCISERQEMNVSPNFVYTKNLSKRELLEETIEVWDYLVENDYHPADFSCGVVTIYVEGFARLVAESDGLASVVENNIYRTSAVWIGNVQINFTEFKQDRQGGWSLTEDWKPL